MYRFSALVALLILVSLALAIDPVRLQVIAAIRTSMQIFIPCVAGAAVVIALSACL
ncbi:MAG: hypothetical protein WCD79_12065 [Chthoniobacteraceae bacterium]